jgi:AcrR family transcriptional regulator
MYVSPVAAAKRKHVREPYQLPAGRHGLPGDFVIAHQRQRMLAAVVEVCHAGGYGAMSVQDVVVAAGVSRKTFYLHFRDKEDVFLATYDDASHRIATTLRAAAEQEDDPVDRVRACLRALLDTVASAPALASLCLVEVLAAGPEALERRDALMGELVALVDECVARELPASRRPSPLIAETLVGGIHDVLASRVMSGRAAEVPALLPDLMFALLLPYVGMKAARAQLTRERRRMARRAAA